VGPACWVARAASRRLPAEINFLIGFARLVRTDADGHLAFQPLQEIKQLVSSDPAEMPVHEVGHFRLLNAEHGRDLTLRQLVLLSIS